MTTGRINQVAILHRSAAGGGGPPIDGTGAPVPKGGGGVAS
jgi:hypothetical protein